MHIVLVSTKSSTTGAHTGISRLCKPCTDLRDQVRNWVVKKKIEIKYTRIKKKLKNSPAEIPIPNASSRAHLVHPFAVTALKC